MSKKLAEYKHVGLLATLIVAQVVQPELAHRSVLARVFSAVVIFGVAWAVFLQLFEARRERWIGVVLVLPAIAAELLHYGLPDNDFLMIAVAFHISLAAFLAFALWVILRHVFRKRELVLDDVVGAFSGYLITGIVFGNLYAMVWLLVPNSFNINSHIAWQLAEWHTRRGLFAYFSFATLASVGYGDITTTAPTSNTLVWLEVMFGQFYMAVVVATIVGTKLAHALSPKRSGDV